MICPVCETLGFFTAGLCLRCLLLVRRTRLPDDDAGLLKTLFFYEGPVKDMILRAKIGHDQHCIRFLSAVFSRSHLIERACQRNDVILAVPSSLWSRFHGRLDLAYALIHQTSSAYGLPLVFTPHSFGWHFQKQAHRKDRTLTPGQQLIRLPHKRVLIIDDIRTSGHTLRAIESRLEALSYESITLARTKE